MSTTCSKMIAEVRGNLQSWNLDEEQSTTLAGTMGSADVTFSVTTSRGIATGASPGIIEIDDELLFVDSINSANGNCTVPTWGRGYLSTTAATHVAGARVISQPSFPRSKILDNMNQVLNRIFPGVFAVKVVNLTTTLPAITYDLPDDAQWVLAARWQVPDGTGYWRGVRGWRMSPAGTLGVSVDIGDSMMPGRPLQVIYAAKPAPLVNETDDFETVTGLGLGLADVVTLGAAAALTVGQESSRLQMSSVEQQNRAQLVAPSAALTTSRFLNDRFKGRLAEERLALQRLYPPRITRSWI